MAPPTAPASGRRRPHPRLVDAVLAVALVLAAFVPFDAGPGRTVGAADARVLLGVPVAVAIVLLRRRFPVASFGGALALYCGLAVLGLLSPAFVLAVAFTVFAVAVTRSRRLTVVLTAAAALVLPVVSLVAAPSDVGLPVGFLSARAVQLGAIVAFAAASGSAVRARRAEIVALEGRALRAERQRDAEARRSVAEDRLRIARDLHDTVAHRIAVINLHAGVASGRLREDPPAAERSLEVIRGAAREVLTEIGDLLALLRAPDAAGQEPPDLTALDDLLSGFAADGLSVTRSDSGHAVPLPRPVGSVAYQVVREGLTNAGKHGDGSGVRLDLDYRADRLGITLDNGVGRHAVVPPSGFGLAGIRERVAAVGGSVDASSAAGRFRLHADLPVALRAQGAA